MKLIRSKMVNLGLISQNEVTHITDIRELNKLYAYKIMEELGEIQASDHKDIMEFADLLQVVINFAELNGMDLRAINNVMAEKAKEKGGFNTLVLTNLNPTNPSNTQSVSIYARELLKGYKPEPKFIKAEGMFDMPKQDMYGPLEDEDNTYMIPPVTSKALEKDFPKMPGNFGNQFRKEPILEVKDSFSKGMPNFNTQPVSIGRIVGYSFDEGANDVHPAMVTRAMDQQTVNLIIWTDDKRCGTIKKEVPYGSTRGNGFWYWMVKV